ncbi:hypothetical protein LXA43DRAFT_1135459 [Ganoderma leucocontextum]|nr:hypothetical protein LXA43DRAFT_1135459 [Ganoderma leucocontextum]
MATRTGIVVTKVSTGRYGHAAAGESNQLVHIFHPPIDTLFAISAFAQPILLTDAEGDKPYHGHGTGPRLCQSPPSSFAVLEERRLMFGANVVRFPTGGEVAAAAHAAPGPTSPPYLSSHSADDGVFLSGHNVKCDESESGAINESDAIKKVSYLKSRRPRARSLSSRRRTDGPTTRVRASPPPLIPFSSEHKGTGVVVQLNERHYRVYRKGASEILTKRSKKLIIVARGSKQTNDIETVEIDEFARDTIQRTIIFYANQMLRTIAVCYRDFESWPPQSVHAESNDEVPYEVLSPDLTLIDITAIEDPLRPGVRGAVATRARIRQDQDLLDVVPRLQVLARSSPEDKKLLVDTLRDLGEIVGVTGDGTNHGPALKTAHVDFSTGIAGTEVAKEASDIILMDDNFASIVKAIMWGQCVNDAVRKFLQFQISTNIIAVIITFVSAVASTQEESVLSAVQLLWINIIMDTFAALALAADPASPSLLDCKPDKKIAPLFSVDMYKQILGQSTYQTIITLIFYFLGARILGQQHSDDSTTQKHVVQTLVFNLFVFAQIFNSINSRQLDNRLNVFEGITRNYYFMGIILLEVAVQILIVVVSLPLGALLRCIPNAPLERFFIKVRLMPNPNVLPTVQPEVEWNSAIQLVRDNLNTFSHVRGARMRASSYVGKSRNPRLAPESRLALPSIMTIVPSLIASSIGAGWAPQSPTGLSNPASFDPSKIHPDTKPDDPIMQRWGSVVRTT